MQLDSPLFLRRQLEKADGPSELYRKENILFLYKFLFKIFFMKLLSSNICPVVMHGHEPGCSHRMSNILQLTLSWYFQHLFECNYMFIKSLYFPNCYLFTSYINSINYQLSIYYLFIQNLKMAGHVSFNIWLSFYQF